MTTESPDDAGTVQVPGRIALFGYDPVEVRLELLPRSRRWRLWGAGRTAAVALVLAPVAGLVPPHAPWILGVLGVGGFLARRRWQERFTVVDIDGTCPKCEAELSVAQGRLRTPHPVPCEGCHHDSSVQVAPETLKGVESRD